MSDVDSTDAIALRAGADTLPFHVGDGEPPPYRVGDAPKGRAELARKQPS